MKWRLSITALFCFLTGNLGCQSRPALQADMGGAEIRFVAEPKKGIHRESTAIYDDSIQIDSYDRINYGSLPGIVVWIESLDEGTLPRESSQPTFVIELNDQTPRSRPPTQGLAVGTKLVIHNRSSRGQAVYCLSEGNQFDLGSIPINANAEYVVQSPGTIEVLSESLAEPVARFYAVIGKQVQTVRSNEIVYFAPLQPGRYSINCWHERLPGSTQIVAVEAGKWLPVSLKLSVNLLPAYKKP